MATVFRNYSHLEFFQLCISDVIDMCQIKVPIVSNTFGDDRSNSKEIAAVFRNQRWRQPSSSKVHFWLNHHQEK